MSSLSAFSGKIWSLLFWQKCNVIFVGKRNTIFTKYTENIIFPCIIIIIIIISERSSCIFRIKNNIIFPRKKISPFLIIQKRSCSKRQSFQNIWRTNIWFLMRQKWAGLRLCNFIKKRLQLLNVVLCLFLFYYETKSSLFECQQ